MTKTKRRTLASIIVMLLACAVVALSMSALVTARAAWDAFNSDTDGNDPAYYGGVAATEDKTAKEVITEAAVKKVNSLNAAITAATTGEGAKSLSEAYEDGDIIVYSNASDDGLLTAGNNARSNWKTWDKIPVADLKRLNAGYDGWGDNYVGWLSYDSLSGEVYVITAEFAKDYSGNGKKLGTAASDMFRVYSSDTDYITYQNFAGGYMKREGSSVSHVFGKNVDEDGNEIAANPRGFIGVANDTIASSVGTTNKALQQAFIDAYDRYLNDEFNAGYPFTVVVQENDLTLQYFRNGDSVSNPYNDGERTKWAYLAYNEDDACAYLIKDEFARLVETNGNAKQIGYPTGDAFLASDGNRYQNFSNGYMKADGADPNNSNATMKSGVNVDMNGAEQEIDIANNIGMFGPTVSDGVIPSSYTAAEFSAAIKSAYREKVDFSDDETLAKVDKVVYSNGYISQTYTDNKGNNHMLAYSEEINDFVYFRPAVVDKLLDSLGKPVGERMLVATVDGEKNIYAYPFENGYIKLTSQMEETIEGGDVVVVLTESAVATEGATFDSDKVFFETVSYSDSITESTVKHTSSGDDQSVDNAYWTLWGKTQPTDAQLVEAFKTAYNEAFEIGFSAGRPSDGGIVFWKTGNSGVIKLTFKGGNGNANFWGDNTIMLYNPVTGKVHISTGALANCYANDGASGNGWATTDMLVNTESGIIVQQFDIHDSVVETRPIYIIVENGRASKVSGTYDFEANKGSGEWVNYLSQFGGSISSTPVNLAPVQSGANVAIDFSDYIVNKDGYIVKYNLVSDSGSLSNDGKFTLNNVTANTTVTVEAYSAFDKLTFNVNVTLEGASGGDNGDDNKDDGGKKRCGSVAVGSTVAGALLALGLSAAALFIRKRKQNA